MVQLKDLTGQRFGKLTVIERAPSGNDKRKRVRWLCRCDCGTEMIRASRHLMSGVHKACNLCMRRVEISGQIFGRLTVQNEYRYKVRPDGTKLIEWFCLCQCGNTLWVLGPSLITGNTKSCGCLYDEREYVGTYTVGYGIAARNSLLRNYKDSAKERGYEFNLTDEETINLFLGNCYYCGEPPSNPYKGAKTFNGTFIYNGIDRMDNSMGYTTKNCVSCCKRCNFAKGTMSSREFVQWITRVYHHLNQDCDMEL